MSTGILRIEIEEFKFLLLEGLQPIDFSSSGEVWSRHEKGVAHGADSVPGVCRAKAIVRLRHWAYEARLMRKSFLIPRSRTDSARA